MTHTPAFFISLLMVSASWAVGPHAPLGDPPNRVEKFAFEEICKKVDADPRHDYGAIGRAKIAAAVDEALKAQGHASLVEAAMKRLTDAGLPFEKLDAATAKTLGENLLKDWFGTGETSPDGVTDAPEVTPDALRPKWLNECSSTSSGLPSPKDGEKAADLIRAHLKTFREMAERETQLMLKLTPTELFSSLAQMCRALRYYSKEAPTSTYCREAELRRLKNETVRLYADAAKPERRRTEDALKAKLVGAYREARDKSRSLPSPKLDPDKIDEAKTGDAYVGMSNAVSAYCDGARQALRTATARAFNELRDEISQSRPMVKALEAAFLSDKHYENADKLVAEAGGAVAELFEKELAPRAKFSASTIAGVVKELKALRTLRHEPLPEGGFNPLDDYLRTSPFVDSSLAAFRDLGASYHPEMKLGAKTVRESVSVGPLVMHLAMESPTVARSILFHEAGHKLGPNLKEVTGIDLSATLEKLKACFKKQFNLRDKEMDEAFADWISATIAGRRIAAIEDPKKREAELLETIAPFCNFQKTGYSSQTFGGSDDHPHSLIRIERIFGADPNLRKAQGLPPAPYCTLEGEKS